MSDTPRTDIACAKMHDKVALLRQMERELAEANVCEAENFRRAEENLKRADAIASYAVQLREAGERLVNAVVAYNAGFKRIAETKGAEPPREETERCDAEVGDAMRAMRAALATNPAVAAPASDAHSAREAERPGYAPVTAGPDREAVLQEAWNAVDALIKVGELPLMEHQMRNGMVMAANAIAALLGWPKAKYAEEIPHDCIPVPPGYRHDDRCAYRVSVRNHCTCGYVAKEPK